MMQTPALRARVMYCGSQMIPTRPGSSLGPGHRASLNLSTEAASQGCCENEEEQTMLACCPELLAGKIG